MFNNKVFWKEGFDGDTAQGGYFFRAPELKNFLQRVEEAGGEVVGLKMDDNNIEIIVNKK